MVDETPEIGSPPAKSWIKRLGIVAFLFFFLKGLVWLAIFAAFGSHALSPAIPS